MMTGRWLATTMVALLLGSSVSWPFAMGPVSRCTCDPGHPCPLAARHAGGGGHHHGGAAQEPGHHPSRCSALAPGCQHPIAALPALSEPTAPPPPTVSVPLPLWAGWLPPAAPVAPLDLRSEPDLPPPRPLRAV